MKVEFYGTGGSCPVSNPNRSKYGGNTTCVRVESETFPEDMVVAIDGGSGFVPMSVDVLKKEYKGKKKDVRVFFTHAHHDHNQGVPLSPLLYAEDGNKNYLADLAFYGPIDSGVGPREILEKIMVQPLFPVHFKEVGSHLKFKGFDFPKNYVVVIHPQGGLKILNVDEYRRLIDNGDYLPINKGKYPVGECMVITMHKSQHPEQTVSYRFAEMPTGKVFVIATDHENQTGISTSFLEHLRGVNLLVMDSQYTEEKYQKMTVGWGHGTPDYCAKIALAVNAERLGLTHHDPFATDQDIDAILKVAEDKLLDSAIKVFACKDYEYVEV